jgi:hypothetical protein
MVLLVGVVLHKHILKRSKLDWFVNEQQAHKMHDFSIQIFYG